MAGADWLLGRNRHDAGSERILAAAADLIGRMGYEAFTIEALAAKVHCSPATIYRRAGGKAAIREGVISMQANRVLETVREAIDGRTGRDRVVTATIVALQRLRSYPLVQLPSTQLPVGSEWITTSPVIAAFAAEMLGEQDPDPLATQWLIHVFMSLWYWPLKDPAAERAMVERFLGQSYNELG
ncbi:MULTISPECIES: TetR/AcrR family transcriptional regulator [Mycobacterium]|uniref:Transcriptional regulator n=1 Tax=Mycobacterium kiyosense TaxID=2871094 RepID=A0A9P3Q738_9MYCO|nr:MULTISPECIES: TetR/AcrR family transcriptional regulator [Mycobacterium]BDB39761.1 transcriptional regulator [Mycobacterium kiyosense]BDE11616.1 transcriptional regulator [Mycobacterium sp. 20KCMC460]GLB81894.1 transcriptional regulator [Mycobacterium kiyosense]GLB88146.1 transcriptional regulator [Mycobacterium kiyosense]GLB95706.1 transcriptional regulator [Mycobacterium kiyosense]